MPLEPKALLVADTDRTQDYVFESSRLPELRGASWVLDDLNHWSADQVRALGGGAEVIVEGGGSLLALIPNEPAQARALCERIEAEYARRTTTATITAAFRPISEAMLQKGYPAASRYPFGSLMSWASTWLRREKDGRDALPWVDSPAHAERCSSCSLRPASPAASLPGRPLCSVCRSKAQMARDFSWFKALWGQPSGPRIWEPHDLSEIGQMSRGQAGYIGFIYLDGDEMGRAFEETDTPASARTLSQTIAEVARATVKEALDRYASGRTIRPSAGRADTEDAAAPGALDAQGRLLIYPFEILTIGGDDLMLIVPADEAIPIACQISQQFPLRLRQRLDQQGLPRHLVERPYTLSGGVVLADDHNPVRTLRDLARELKSSAKKARRDNKATDSYLDFVALLGTDVPDRDLKKARRLYPYLVEQPGFQPLSLLGRPYSAARLAQAWGELGALRKDGFPNSQMSTLAEILPQGVQESGLFYKYQRERDRQGKFRHLEMAINILMNRSPEAPAEPWESFTRASKISAKTVLWDLAELYSLVP